MRESLFYAFLACLGLFVLFIVHDKQIEKLEASVEVLSAKTASLDSLQAAYCDSLTALHCREAQLQASLNALARRLHNAH